MPIYKTPNGDLVSRTERYVSVFPPESFVLVEGAETNEERRERERQEALELKVDIEDEPPADNAPPAQTDSGVFHRKGRRN